MQPVPTPAQSLILFANSRRLGGRQDLLADRASAGKALTRAGLLPAGTVPTPSALRRLVALRAALNAALAGQPEAWTAIDAEAARLRIRLSFGAGPDASVRTTADGDPVAALLLTLYEAVAHGSWSRLRRCANDVCAAAFYDTTRSRTGRWCSYARCGNRTNVAAHRARTAVV
jgi:predicted RNA-binding Zn ribbon-like protein